MSEGRLQELLRDFQTGTRWQDRFLAQQIELMLKDIKRGVGVLGLEQFTPEDAVTASMFGIQL